MSKKNIDNNKKVKYIVLSNGIVVFVKDTNEAIEIHKIDKER